jgi:hypothetical protein
MLLLVHVERREGKIGAMGEAKERKLGRKGR